MSIDAQTVASVYDFLAHEGETEVRVIDPHRVRRPRSIFVRSKASFVGSCQRYNGLYNVYAGLNQRRSGGTKRDDIISVKSIVLDLDAVRQDKHEPATDEELERVHYVAERIAEDSELFGFHCPNVCMSGNGYQLWYAIPAILITDKNRDEVEARIKAFHRLVKEMYESEVVSIDNIGDLPRVIKVMGTLSIKGHNTEERPHRLSYCVGNMVRKEDPYLREYILSLSPRLSPEPELRSTAHRAATRTPPEFSHLMQRDAKLRRLYSGDVAGYRSRSEAEMALLVKLVYYGFSRERIWHLMGQCAIGKWQESREQYRAITYEKALHYLGLASRQAVSRRMGGV